MNVKLRMSPSMSRFTRLCLVPMLLVLSALAQDQATSVPNLIRYSGALKNLQGAASVTPTTVGVTFSIYKQQDGGAAVWQETQNVTPDANGQYSVLLGSTNSSGLPDDLFSQQEQRWLSVQVQGQEEQARVLLVSVPYAFKAHEADTLGGLPASAFLKAPTASSTGGAASTETGAVVATVGNTAAAGTTSTTLGTSSKGHTPCPPLPNHIMYWDPSDDICPSQITQDPITKNIGIGVANPSEPLDVQGVISTYTWYDINENRILSVGNTGTANNASTNLFLGWFAGAANNGDTNNNTFVGREAGPANTTGHDNTFSGYQAGNANVGGTDPAGSYNTFSGSQSGLLNKTGAFNTFSGYTAGYGNTSGYQNSCFGSAACLHNLTGIQNVAVGAGAGFRNMDGSANVYVGFDSGWGNSGVGSRGSNNTMTGWETGFDNFGSNNVFYGYKAGFSNTTGSSNIAIGANAGSTAGPGNSNNIYLGNPGQNENNAIRIGVQGTQQFNTYIAGIWPTPIPNGTPVLVDSTGHLGIPASLGTSFVIGNCPSPGTYYLTKWLSSTQVQCSSITELSTGTSNVGIGPTTTNPNRQLQVNGDIDILKKDANTHYQITEQTVLSIDGTNNLFTGVGAGTASGTTTGNTFTGYNAGNVNTADGNSFYGFESGAANTTGIQNVFAGYQSGVANNTGYSNIFIGYKAGQANTTESYSTFVGTVAGFNSTVGGNTFLGYSAGSNTTVGYGNVATGYDAGRSNQDGILNAYFGVNAGFNGSLTNFTHGSYNTFLGNGAGSTSGLVNGSNNIFVGFAAGNAETDVSNSIEIGNSGATNYGNGSIQIGTLGAQINKTYIQGIYTNPTNLNTFVTVAPDGHLGENTVTIGSGNITGGCNPPGSFFLTKWNTPTDIQCSSITELANTNVGIGTTAPARQLDVNGEINTATHYEIRDAVVLSIDGGNNTLVGVGPSSGGTETTIVGTLAGASNSGASNTFVGFEAGVNNGGQQENTFLGAYSGLQNNAGIRNTFVGYDTGNAFTTGNGNVFLGWSAGNNNTSGTNDIYIGNLGCVAPCVENSTIRIGNNPFFGGAQTDTYVSGIWSSAPGGPPQIVCVDSTGKLWGSTTGCMGSSRRFKDEIANMDESSSKLFQLRPVTFFYKPQYDDGSHHLQYGLIAEEVAKVYPEMAVYDKDGQASGVKYQMLAPMLLNELQKQHTVVLAQQQQIDTLKSQLQLQNAAFQERLSRLESLLTTQVATTSTPSSVASTPNGGR